MEEVNLSEKAQKQIVELTASNERLLAEALVFEARTKELEALAQR